MTEATAQPIADGLTRKHKPTTDEVVGETEPMETLLKKPEIKRDPEGRFERHGKMLAKTAKKSGLIKSEPETKAQHGGFRPGSGRKPGSKNKITLQLKEAVLAALDEVGGHKYLAKLAIENSSAFAALLGRILPHTLAAASDSDGGKQAAITFQRIIVWPDGHREIEGVTPKQITHERMPHQPQVGENSSNEGDER